MGQAGKGISHTGLGQAGKSRATLPVCDERYIKKVEKEITLL